MIESIESKQSKYRKIVIFFTILMILVFFSIVAQITGILRTKSEILEPVCEWTLNKSILMIVNPSFIKDANDALDIIKSFETKHVNYSSHLSYDKCIGYIVELEEERSIIDKFMVCKTGYVYKYDKFCRKIEPIETIKKLPEQLKQLGNVPSD